jgi:ribokinase
MMSEQIDLVVAGNLAIDEVYGEEFFGGSAGNIAINAALGGLRSAVVSNIGTDASSDRYLRYLHAVGVETTLLQPSLTEIARCVISSAVNHSSSKEWFDNGTSAALRDYEVNDVHNSLLSDARFLHLTTAPPNLGMKLIDSAGCETLVGYEPGPRIHNDFSFFDTELLARSDFLFLNEEEAQTIDCQIGLNAVRQSLNPRQLLVVTQGENGVTLLDARDAITIKPEEVVTQARLVDSSGAGDAFKVGFYVGYAKDNDPVIAAQYGNRYGSMIIQQRGAIFHKENASKLPVIDQTVGAFTYQEKVV